MPYDENLAQRLRQTLAVYPNVTEKKMFGGLSFMLGDHMCCGAVNEDLVVRVGPEQYEQALSQPHARNMDFTGRPMRGMVFVGPGGCATDETLSEWVRMGVSFASSLPPKTRKSKG